MITMEAGMKDVYKRQDIDRYVVNMPWKEKRDFFERMARYVLRILNNTEKGE